MLWVHLRFYNYTWAKCAEPRLTAPPAARNQTGGGRFVASKLNGELRWTWRRRRERREPRGFEMKCASSAAEGCNLVVKLQWGCLICHLALASPGIYFFIFEIYIFLLNVNKNDFFCICFECKNISKIWYDFLKYIFVFYLCKRICFCILLNTFKLNNSRNEHSCQSLYLLTCECLGEKNTTKMRLSNCKGGNRGHEREITLKLLFEFILFKILLQNSLCACGFCF